jgi:hypothetical protein
MPNLSSGTEPVIDRQRSANVTGNAAEPLVAKRNRRAPAAQRARVVSSALSKTSNNFWYIVGTAIHVVGGLSLANSSHTRRASNFCNIRVAPPDKTDVMSDMPPS